MNKCLAVTVIASFRVVEQGFCFQPSSMKCGKEFHIDTLVTVSINLKRYINSHCVILKLILCLFILTKDHKEYSVWGRNTVTRYILHCSGINKSTLIHCFGQQTIPHFFIFASIFLGVLLLVIEAERATFRSKSRWELNPDLCRRISGYRVPTQPSELNLHSSSEAFQTDLQQ